ncbi:MAG: ASKHA domain-containing protein [Anaerolineaceae bacterium]|nr:ASKHA domain-containing protein [Anaerolineaceae bacterium]
MTCTVLFNTPDGAPPKSVVVPAGTTVSEAAALVGIEIGQPCGGQGRCGRCAVRVTAGKVHRRSTMRLSDTDLSGGYALACQSVVDGDATIFVAAQEKVDRRLTSDRVSNGLIVPAGYDFQRSQTIRRCNLTLTPPTLDDQTDNWSRLQMALASQFGLDKVSCSLHILRRLSTVLQEGDWKICALIEQPNLAEPGVGRLIEIHPGLSDAADPVWGAAVDIGTTTVTFWLVDLVSGMVEAQAAEYNGQIDRGEDVISRIVYASKNGPDELQEKVIETINDLCDIACRKMAVSPRQIVKATIAGNPTMVHLLLGIPADSLRLAPFVPVVNQPSSLIARELGLHFCPEAVIDILPGVASYVGGDITAGVLSSGLAETDQTTLFIDVGTNGEIVLGNRDWLMTCACSAGPAFEGAGVKDGMRAARGAIDEVWINAQTYEPNFRVIGEVKPRGICGSGLIILVAEMFLTGILDKAGHINLNLPTPRVRPNERGGEYVLVWAKDSATAKDIVLTRTDVDNLLRAKAAIYAGFSVLVQKVGLSMDDVQQMYIGGSFGKYVNVEKAVQIGLLPDMAWDQFKYLGNTSVTGAYLALLDAKKRSDLQEIASKMTYIELSADNAFYEEFTSALFLPHTDLSKFPNVAEAISKMNEAHQPTAILQKVGDPV